MVSPKQSKWASHHTTWTNQVPPRKKVGLQNTQPKRNAGLLKPLSGGSSGTDNEVPQGTMPCLSTPLQHPCNPFYVCDQLDCLTDERYSFERKTLAAVASVALSRQRQVQRICCSCVLLAKTSNSPIAAHSNGDVSGFGAGKHSRNLNHANTNRGLIAQSGRSNSTHQKFERTARATSNHYHIRNFKKRLGT